MVGVQDGPGGDQVGVVVGAGVPRDVQHRVQPGPDPAGLRALVGGPLQLADLGQRGLAHVLGQVGGLHPGPVVVGAVGLVLAQLLADRGQLLAQQELALGLLHALADVLGDLLRDLLLGHVLAGPADQQLQPLDHVGLGQQLRLLLQVEVGGPAGGVGQLAGVGDLLDGVDDLPGAALLQDADDQGLVLLGQLGRPAGDRAVLDRGDLHPQRRTRSGHAGPDLRAALAAHHGGLLPVGEPADLLEDGDRAHGGVPAVEAGNDDDLAIDAATTTLRRVDRCLDLRLVEPDGNHHAGQHHRVGERKHRQLQRLCHARLNRYTVELVPAFKKIRSQRTQEP